MNDELFRAEQSVDGSTLTATFHGNAEADSFEDVARFIQQVGTTALEKRVDRVVADLRDLEFATSSSLKVFAGWLIDVEERSAPYQVEFLASSKHHWQRRSLQALAACAPSVVQVRMS